jgi:NAD+ diphosphatase
MEHRQLYADGSFDRAAERREDEEWIARRLADPTTRIHPVADGKCLVDGNGRPMALAAADLSPDPDAAYLLGVDGGAAHFVLDVDATGAALEAEGEWLGLRDFAIDLAHEQAALLAYGRGLVHWHRTHLYCGVCGNATRSSRAGHVRICSSEDCGRMHFPRTDPAVITLVSDGERCLLARRGIWAANRRSTIAGFVEPGETLEDAVRREILEEVGVRVGAVRYRGSQPWPFPSSLMMGFHADAETTEITPDGEEIVEGEWYTREDLDRMTGAGDLVLPPADSISRWLVDLWVDKA